MRCHPASCLVLWCCGAVVFQWLPLAARVLAAVLALILMLVFSRIRGLRLIRRTRWLFISLLALYLFFTPGEFVPGMAGGLGVTVDGLKQGSEQIALLLFLLACLALLHEKLGTKGLLSGLYALLGRFPFGERTIVRLALIMDYAESEGNRNGWREWLDMPSGEGDSVETLSFSFDAPDTMNRVVMIVMPGLVGFWGFLA